MRKRYSHNIWNPHCLIGSPGATVVPELFNSFLKWESMYFGMVDYVTKGSNFWTEHFSAVQAEVPDPDDPSTMLDLSPNGLIQTLKKADMILLAGEARDFCVYNTLKDIVDNFGEENIQKFAILEDCMSNVFPTTPIPDQFYESLKQKGVLFVKSTEILK